MIEQINYRVEVIDPKAGKAYISQHHYLHGSTRNPTLCIGLLDGDKLIGVMIFSCPCSENVRASIFGPGYEGRVIELSRLHILDVTPKNTESWFISRALKLLKRERPEFWAVISFSDINQGHPGIIYQATNAYRIGDTKRTRIVYVDDMGRTRSGKVGKNNITPEMAYDRGWKCVIRGKKNRYLWLLPDSKKHKRHLIALCRYDIQDQRFH